jgi:hypothetical protein
MMLEPMIRVPLIANARTWRPSSATRRGLLFRSHDALSSEIVFLVQKIAGPFGRFSGWTINTIRSVLDLSLTWTDDIGILTHRISIFVFCGLLVTRRF